MRKPYPLPLAQAPHCACSAVTGADQCLGRHPCVTWSELLASEARQTVSFTLWLRDTESCPTCYFRSPTMMMIQFSLFSLLRGGNCSWKEAASSPLDQAGDSVGENQACAPDFYGLASFIILWRLKLTDSEVPLHLIQPTSENDS